MAQAVSGRPVTAEDLVRVRVSPCGICGVQSDTGTGFSPSSSVFPVNIIPPWLSILVSYAGGLTIGPVLAAVQRHILTPSS
jgi:hypothetical protein